jgi:hypothetical protein
MDTNELFDGIMKSINQFADEIVEQRLQEKICLRQGQRGMQVQDTGRNPENEGKMRRILGRKRSGV